MSDPRIEAILAHTVDVPDFPKPGILFKDVTPIFADPATFRGVLELFAERIADRPVDVVVGIEARGFILASALAQALGRGFVPVRKLGKLPRATHRETYDLEYGTDALELHRDAFAAGARVVLVDDVLATGGTAAAASRLIRAAEGELVQALFLLELSFLEGRRRLPDVACSSLVTF